MGVTSYLVVGGETLSETRNGVKSDYCRGGFASLPSTIRTDVPEHVNPGSYWAGLSQFGLREDEELLGGELNRQPNRLPRSDLHPYVRWLLPEPDVRIDERYRYIAPKIVVGSQEYRRLDCVDATSRREERN